MIDDKRQRSSWAPTPGSPRIAPPKPPTPRAPKAPTAGPARRPVPGPQGVAAAAPQAALAARQQRGATPLTQPPMMSMAGVVGGAMDARQQRGATPLSQAPTLPAPMAAAGASAAENALSAMQQRGATPLSQPVMPPVGGPQLGAAYAPQADIQPLMQVEPMQGAVAPPRSPSVGGVPLQDTRLPAGRLLDVGAFGPGPGSASVAGVPLADTRLPQSAGVEPLGGAVRAPMTNEQGLPLTVRGSEQSRMLGEQMGGEGTQPMQRFNYQIPREVRQGGYERAEQPARSPMEQYQRGQQARENMVRGVGEAVDNTAANLKAAVTPPPIAAGFLGLAAPGEVSPPKRQRGVAQAAEMPGQGDAVGGRDEPETPSGAAPAAGKTRPVVPPEQAQGPVAAPGQAQGPVAGPAQGSNGNAAMTATRPERGRVIQTPEELERQYGMPIPDQVPLSQNLSPRERQGMQGGNPAGGVVPESVRKKSIDEYVNPQLPNMTYDEAEQAGIIKRMSYGDAKRSGAVNAQPYNGSFDYDPTTGMYIAKRPDSAKAPMNARTVQGPKVGRWLPDGQYGDNRVTTENGVQVIRGKTPADTSNGLSQKDVYQIEQDRFKAELDMAKYLNELQQGGQATQQDWWTSANETLAERLGNTMGGEFDTQRAAVASELLTTLQNSDAFMGTYGSGAGAANAALAMTEGMPQPDDKAFRKAGSAQEQQMAYQAALTEWLNGLYEEWGLLSPAS